jgi:hypothetical protein
VTNDTACNIADMVIRNTLPDGSISAPIQCISDDTGLPTNALLDGASCHGTLLETVNVCAGGVATDTLNVVAATGHGAAQGSASANVTVPTCTPTNTPTITPTNTPTPTATPGPSGLLVLKECPSTASGGSTITCSFQVSNLSSTETVTGIQVSNNEKFDLNITGPWDCFIGPSIVTSLGPNASCNGTLTETAPACNVVANYAFTDQILAVGTYSGSPRYGYSPDVTVQILACTPTPTNSPTPGAGTPSATPTVTPTNTPTGTATYTPTVTPTGNTPTPTKTFTPSRTPTITNTFPPTLTVTRTPTRTPTAGVPVTVTRTPTPRPSCGTILTGTIRNAAGSPLAINGVVWFQLSSNGNAACCVPPFQVGPQPPITYTLTNGTIQGAAFLVGNRCISPPGSCFLETVIDRNGNIVLRKNVFVDGATANVGTLPSCVPTSR